MNDDTSNPPLAPGALRRRCDTSAFTFGTTEELDDVPVAIGQDRALDALTYAVEITREGYNVFALGPEGTGKFTVIQERLREVAAARPVPPDWCYVNNFDAPQQPMALRLPPGDGRRLSKDMADLVEELGTAIPSAFDNEDTHARVEEIEEELQERRNRALQALREEGVKRRIAVIETPTGFSFAPIGPDNQVLSPEQYRRLSEEAQARIQKEVEALQDQLQKLLRQFQTWRKEARERTKALQRDIAQFAVGSFIEELRQRYRHVDEVVEYLGAVERDLVDHVNDFLAQPELPFGLGQLVHPGQPLKRYTVNLVVDNADLEGAPVVLEALPTHANLIGRTEHQAQMGTLVTDFTLIRPGALHRSNGGFLLLDVRKVLLQPYAWESIKRALQSREIRIESLERSLGLMSTVSLEPEAIPLDVKVVLVGDRRLYYLMYELDPDFANLFKVPADFDQDMKRNDSSDLGYARVLATIARRAGLKPLDREAVGRAVERAARIAGDNEKLSIHLRSIVDLLTQADYWAGKAGRTVITAADVDEAVRRHRRLSSRIEERIRDETVRGTLLVATEGERIGQINGLAVTQLGEIASGHPTRITATTRLGEGEVVDIEREIEMGGPIHSKGVLILSNYLMSRYVVDQPISLTASLVFEQSYSGVEGDSASLAELCALLSALARVPLRQALAVTGSVNQHGEVQAIGGVNEKIEGFFDLCAERGLGGAQGVLIPEANVKHLMLREDVVAAAADGKFAVYPVAHVDQAMAILTGTAAGARGADGAFPADSVNDRVERRLGELARIRRRYAGKEDSSEAPI